MFPLAAADPPKKPMRETATVAADANVLKRLGTVNDYLADKRWAEAVDILYEIAQSEGRSLVEAQPGQAGGSAVYLNVATRCQVLLSRMPKEGLAAYRRKIDPQAKRWFENWQRTRDASELERLVRQAYLSSYGDDALWALGEAAWDRGDYSSSRLHWSQLVPLTEESRAASLPTVLRYPDSNLDAASVVARLVLCSLMEGHRERAIDQQQHFAERYPMARGNLAGRQGRLTEILKQILDEAAAWDAASDEAEVATFGLAPERTQILPSVVDVGAPRWQQPLTPNLLPPLERFRSAPDRGPLSTHPVVFRDIVLVNDADAISAFNLLTGEPAWPTERGTARIYPPVSEERSGAPDRICVGVPWFTMTVADGKLFARMGSPVTSKAPDTELRDLTNDLVCLDLAEGQGKLVWKIAAEEWHHEGERPWRFEGSPLVKDGRAYVIHSRRRPQLEFAISCLDAARGERKWTRTLATSRTSIEDNQNRVSHLLPTFGAGKLFVSTDAGAIVAVDARDGRVEWAITYESHPPADAADQSDHAKQGLLPAMFHEGLLFVAPNDCDRLFCIEADSGRVRWQKAQPHRERWRHLLGVAPGGDSGQLIVSGNSLRALDVETGRETWKIVTSDSTERGYGRGVLAGDVVFWPTREAIQIVETATGQPRRNVPLNTPDSAETGGNLTIAGGMLLVAQSEKLVAYGEYSL
ncbi:MAG: PQQ-binding-like beta-propeller repeat protein, partial [Candidatus Saccharimonas sp.]|nr:PQQ-binding-like beta-propeller repeat protein [Planctomycetaceae bacterium]